MNNIKKASILLFMSILFFSTSAHAQPLKGLKIELRGAESNRFEITADKKVKGALTINTSLSVLYAKPVSTKGGNFVKLMSEGLVQVFGKGEPGLPVFSELIEVPLGCTVEYSIEDPKLEIIDLKDYGFSDKIVPAQPSFPRRTDLKKVRFYQDESAYRKYKYRKWKYVDTEVATFENLGILRSARLMKVVIRPIQYNPYHNKLKVFSNLRINVNFLGADYKKTMESKKENSSPLFDQILIDSVANYAAITAPISDPSCAGAIAIISDSIFKGSDTLKRFISSKMMLGYEVIVRYTDELGITDTTDAKTRRELIQSYLINTYENPPCGIPRFDYLLLVGDVDQIPSFPSRVEVETTSGGTTTTTDQDADYKPDHITDLYYCEYIENDDPVPLPDVFCGRFSAEDEDQLRPQVEKTIEHEQYLMSDPSYVSEPVLVAGPDGIAAVNYGNVQLDYIGGEHFNLNLNGPNIADYLYKQHEQDLNPTPPNYYSKLIDRINGGVGFVYYTGHGEPNKWNLKSPKLSPTNGQVLNLQNFTDYDINNTLAESSKYGLWIGNCCDSNRFEKKACFGETALRAANRGAVGYIGASDTTFAPQDFLWAVGCECDESGFPPPNDPAFLGAFDRLFEAPLGRRSKQGHLIPAGNLAVMRDYVEVDSDSEERNKIQYYWEIYHLMGDPSLDVLCVPGNDPPKRYFPSISAVDPSSADLGETKSIAVTGLNFTNDTGIHFWRAKETVQPEHSLEFRPAAVEVKDVTFIDAETLKANITVLANAEIDTDSSAPSSPPYTIKNWLYVNVSGRGSDRIPFTIAAPQEP